MVKLLSIPPLLRWPFNHQLERTRVTSLSATSSSHDSLVWLLLYWTATCLGGKFEDTFSTHKDVMKPFENW